MKVAGWLLKIITKHRNTVKGELQSKKELWSSVLWAAVR